MVDSKSAFTDLSKGVNLKAAAGAIVNAAEGVAPAGLVRKGAELPVDAGELIPVDANPDRVEESLKKGASPSVPE